MKIKHNPITISDLERVKGFMASEGWNEHVCSECGRNFFLKPFSKKNTSVCGWRQCGKGEYQFHTYSKRKKMLTPAQINSTISEYFCNNGFDSTAPMNIANSDGQTDLIVAGVQIFDKAIHHNQKIKEGRIFVAQPCIRMQFQPNIELQEGVSTSFVNICTEAAGASLDEHLQSVDCWFTALSKMGLHMDDMVIIMRTSTKNWGTGDFSALELFFSYGGLEIGDAAYILVPQSNQSIILISDIGFGLERIMWVVNKTNSYFDTLIPWAMSGTREMFDSFRTLALLALCGVQAANKGPGLQFRRLAKALAEKYYGANLVDILEYYFDYWTHFINPSVSRDFTIKSVRLEIERFVNLKICESLKLPPPRKETTEDYISRMVYTNSVDIHQLRKAVQICKN